MSPRKCRTLLTLPLACIGFTAGAAVAEFGADRAPDQMAASIVARGVTGEEVCDFAEAMVSTGVSFGDAAQVLIEAGCSTRGTVAVLLEQGGNQAVSAVLTRVLYVQGVSVIPLIRTTAYALPGIDNERVDRTIALYMGNAHMPIRDPGATQKGDLPERPISNF